MAELTDAEFMGQSGENSSGLSDDQFMGQPAAPEVDDDLARAVVGQESGHRTGLTSPAGAKGLWQVMPDTGRNVAKRLGLEFDEDRLLHDDAYNSTIGKAYLGEMLQRYGGDRQLALAAYNAGPGAVDKWLAAGAKPGGLPDETRKYVPAVLARLASSSSSAGGEMSDDEFMGAPAAAPAAAPPAATGPAPTWGEILTGAVTGGFASNITKARQTIEAATGKPIDEAAKVDPRLAPYLTDPYDWSLGLPNLKKIIGKNLFGLAGSAPQMTGAIVGGAAGVAAVGGPENPLSIISGPVGAGLGAAGVDVAMNLAPIYAEKLKANPGNPDAAFSAAWKEAAQGGAFTGVAFGAFGIAPFQSAIKNVLLQAFAVQPAIGGAEKAVTNLEQGRPAGEGVGTAAAEAGAGTVIPMVPHLVRNAITGKPRPVLPGEDKEAPPPPAPDAGPWNGKASPDAPAGQPGAIPPTAAGAPGRFDSKVEDLLENRPIPEPPPLVDPMANAAAAATAPAGQTVVADHDGSQIATIDTRTGEIKAPPGADNILDMPAKVMEEATGIPFMITMDMKVRLTRLGYRAERIAQMTPAEAHGILRDHAPPVSPAAEAAPPPLAGAARPLEASIRPVEEGVAQPQADATREITPPAEPLKAEGPRPAAAALPTDETSKTVTSEPPGARISSTEPAEPTPDRDLTQPTKADVDLAAAEAHPAPSPEAAKAGNYQKGHVKLHGLSITLENAEGDTRRGKDADGKDWEAVVPAPYGYFKRTDGADGDHVDVTIGPDPQSTKAFVIDQHDPKTGKFDEHKVFLGVHSVEEANALYDRSFSDGSGPSRRARTSETNVGWLKEWLKTGDTKKPFGIDFKVPARGEAAYERLAPHLQALRAQLDAAGFPHVALHLVDRIDAGAGRLANALRIGNLIKMAIDTVDQGKELDHEIVHLAREQLTPAEWDGLRRAARISYRKRYDIDERYRHLKLPEDRLDEEAIADAYADWRAGKLKPQGIVAQAFDRIRLLLEALASFGRHVNPALRERIAGQQALRAARPGFEAVGKGSSRGTFDPADPNIQHSLRDDGDHSDRISTRMPTAQKATEDALRQNLRVDIAAAKQNPEAFAHNVNLATRYTNYRPDPAAKTIDQKVEHFMDHVVGNLLWLHDTAPEVLRTSGKLWYDGARKLVDAWRTRYALPDRSVAGVLAALSPQKDWFMNVSLGERVLDVMRDRQRYRFDDKMRETAARIFRDKREGAAPGSIDPKFKPDLDIVSRSRLGDLDSDYQRAMWLRTFDEAHNSRSYRVVEPEGNFGDLARNQDGQPARVAWGSLGEIGKAIAVIRDPTRENISRRMGEKHKVRNFFNNILAPNAPHGDVTIDTHAVAAALLRPLSGNHLEVGHALATSTGAGRPNAKESATSGVAGLYPIYADAYRRAAAARGILPREMQSITWEAVRGLFRPTFKAQSKNVDAIDAIWHNYRTGAISAEEARSQVHERAGGIENPSWNRPGAGSSEGAPRTSYAGELSRVGLPGWIARALDRGARGGDPEGVTAPVGAYSLRDEDSREIFHSALTRTAEALPQAKGTPEQMLAMLRKGAKEDEIKWTGVEDWLKARGSAVTKQELVDYLKANEVQVLERDSRPIKASDDDVQALRQWAEENPEALGHEKDDPGLWDALRRGDMDAVSEVEDWDAPAELTQPFYDAQDATTQYEEYTVSGNRAGYHELVFTLPSLHEATSRSRLEALKNGPVRLALDEKYGTAGDFHELISKASWEEKQELYSEDDRIKREHLAEHPVPADYLHPHWPHPNVLMHARFTDRLTADGRRTLHVDEIQSDWHQTGRKEGYKEPPKKVDMEPLHRERDEADAAYHALQAARKETLGRNANTDDMRSDPELRAAYDRSRRAHGNVYDAEKGLRTPVDTTGWKAELANPVHNDIWDVRNAAGRFLGSLRAATPEEAIRRTAAMGASDTRVPDAPFKTTWPEIAVRRMLRWAAENGYDRVTWSRGEDIAQVMGIGDRADRVTLYPDGTLTAWDKHGTVLDDHEKVKPEDLPRLVGDEAAARLLAAKPTAGGTRSIRGGIVGIKGMRTFYDQIIPNIFNKIGKKFGTRVRSDKLLPDGDVHVEQDGKTWAAVLTPRRGVHLSGAINPTEPQRSRGFKTKEAAERSAKALAGDHDVHAIDLTPEMQRSAMADQPLFSLRDRLQRVGEHVDRFRDGILDDLIMAVAPMGVRSGSDAARDLTTEFENAKRKATFFWNKFDTKLKKTFTPAQRQQIWDAMDEQSVGATVGRIRRGEVRPGFGWGRLDPEQLAQVRQLDAYARRLWSEMRAIGMVQGEGLAHWTPRMLVRAAAGEPLASIRGEDAGRVLERFGTNVRTSHPSLKHRKYLTAAETEAAAQHRLGPDVMLARDIRAMPLAMHGLEDALAGRRLIKAIKDLSAHAGEDVVVEGGVNADQAPRFFTLDHPAFTTWRPQLVQGRRRDGSMGMVARLDEDGKPVMERRPLYIRKDFEGPLRAILQKQSGPVYNAMMRLKGGAMSMIMYSPLIHNAVEWGRALPLMPGKVFTFRVYGDGRRALQNPEMMRAFFDHAGALIGHQGHTQAISDIMNDPNVRPGRGLTAQGLRKVIGLVSEPAGDAVAKMIDTAGDIWHNKLLWDQVAKLQMGIFAHMRDQLRRDHPEMTQDTADWQAAHLANRFAGALPIEAMSATSRKLANLALFSRTFTLGNLGVFKDTATGLPKNIQSAILRQGGEFQRQLAVKTGRKIAVHAILLDVGLMVAANSIVQDVIDYLSGPDKGNLSKIAQGYVERAQRLMHSVAGNPLEVLDPFALISKLGAGGDNEAGKEDYILVGTDPQGTAIYAKSPVGKMGMEFAAWMHPLDTLMKKQSTFLGPLMSVAKNTDGFGRPIFDPNDKSVAGRMKALGQIAWTFVGAQFPTSSIQAAYNLMTGAPKASVNALKTFGPVAGVTFSQGFPGGPAAGEVFLANKQQQYRWQQASPGVRRQILSAAEVAQSDPAESKRRMDEAIARMRELGLQRYQIAGMLRHTINPSALSPRALREFMTHATDDQKARLQRLQGDDQ